MRHQCNRDNQSLPCSLQHPLLHQPTVRSKMAKFHTAMTSLQVSACVTCMERFPGMTVMITSAGTECARCSKDKHSPKAYSLENNMHPGPVPLELLVGDLIVFAMSFNSKLILPLQGLTHVEEILISAVMPIMSIYKLPHGQYGYSGHVVNLPQDIASFAQCLPRLPSNLDIIVLRKKEPAGMINSFNPVQLSAWRANVDMQYIVSRHRVLQYCSKYVTENEPRSQSLKEVFTSIVRSLQQGNTFLKAVQKLLINTLVQRDYSAQETCHLLLQLPMFKASRDFIILSLDGSRAVEDHLEEGQRATVLCIVDHYMGRLDSSHFNTMTLLKFARQYSMPKTLGAQPTPRSRRIAVIPRPYISPDPAGDKYEQYCRQ